ncbi:hypothetical protein RclHR1_07750006 [Rhizophagus clarus]|uniref:Ricin B lectin domain-containing protein n=1 Tax=Rhizophagus clarus TaxID=94130 RepID=A0A2Z6SM10_9GLOM|nr:hypothetical protein RclHR1_07750006 [Rhizophagus clarus]
MKAIRNSEFPLFFFLLTFIIPIYCYLIPNNRVITDDPEDHDLIEGITYNIVHNMTDTYLISNGDSVQVSESDDSNPYQHWSLRKVKGRNNVYNIINIGSGTNLDNNGEGVYVSNIQHNTVSNPYQHWIFTKIKKNTYNICNTRNGTLHSLGSSIDSNGKIVYIKPFNKNNIYQQWTFEPINYKIITKVIDIDLNKVDDDELNHNKTKIKLISGNNIIENPTNATIEQTVDRIETKSNKFTLEIRKSESFKIGVEDEMRFTITEKNKGTITDEVSYHIQHKVIVPPYTSVQVIVIADKIDFVGPFDAKIQITGKADRLNGNGKVTKMTDVDDNAIKYYFKRENAGSILLKHRNFFYINTSGTLKIDGYGFDSEIKTKNLESLEQRT